MRTRLKYEKSDHLRHRSRENLEELLKEPPPKILRVSTIEYYLLDDKGERQRRICGQRRTKKYPSCVPVGIDNPHKWINPVDQARCMNRAGSWTDHNGIGPCRLHSGVRLRGKDGKRYPKSEDFADYVRENHLDATTLRQGTTRMTDEDLRQGGEFKTYLDKVKTELTTDDLTDTIRGLYELEALKAMLVDQMEESGVTQDRIESIAQQILKSAQYQATTAKRDAAIMQTKAIQALTQVMITGILGIIAENISSEKAIQIMQIFKADLVLPTNQYGYTEMLRRQKASGLADRIALLADSVAEEAKT